MWFKTIRFFNLNQKKDMFKKFFKKKKKLQNNNWNVDFLLKKIFWSLFDNVYDIWSLFFNFSYFFFSFSFTKYKIRFLNINS